MQFPNQKHSLIVKFSRLFNSFFKCVALIIKYLSWNDFTPLNDFFSSGSALLLLALFVNSQFIPSTSAAPIDCQRNTAVCLEEIMKELTQIQFEVKILTENRTLVRCTCTFFLIVLVIPFYLYHYTVYPEKGSLMQGDFHLFSEE